MARIFLISTSIWAIQVPGLVTRTGGQRRERKWLFASSNECSIHGLAPEMTFTSVKQEVLNGATVASQPLLIFSDIRLHLLNLTLLLFRILVANVVFVKCTKCGVSKTFDLVLFETYVDLMELWQRSLEITNDIFEETRSSHRQCWRLWLLYKSGNKCAQCNM